MPSSPTVSVVIATHARASRLARTLDGLARVDRQVVGLDVVVVENGRPDGTRALVESLSDRLPIRYLHSARAGKSTALNLVLERGGLGDVVLFADDDVLPDADWLRAVTRSVERWPARDVFGGRVLLRWPEGPIPGWAQRDAVVRGFAFAQHDRGDEPLDYGGGLFPYGANYWIRRHIFDAGWRFDPRFGPREGSWIPGEETQLLWRLDVAGIHPLYVPDAIVYHEVRPEQLSRGWIRCRAWKEGRGRGAIERPPRKAFLAQHAVLWRIEQLGRAAGAALAYAATRVRAPTDENVLASVWAARRWGAEYQRLVRPPDARASAEPHR